MRAGSAAAMAALALAVTACEHPPTVPTLAGLPEIVGVEVTGPDTIALGQSVQFGAVFRLSDGSRKTAIPTDVRWGFNALFVRVNADGVATATGGIGDTPVSASPMGDQINGFNAGVSTTRIITIIPAGTFRVIGRVTDAEAPSVPVPGALVEVTPGSLVTTTNLLGEYRLFGVPADATIRITKAGFQVVERIVQLTTHSTQDFNLPPDGPRPDLNGLYTLAIDVGGGCTNSGVAANLRNRRYDAVLAQSGSHVDVSLVEPRFRVNSIGRGKGFTGVVFSGGATFTLRGFDPDDPGVSPLDYPNVVEELPDGTVLILSGTVATAGGAGGLTGQMGSGSFLPRWGGFPTTPFFLGGCNYLSPIVFTLTPR